MMAGYTENYIRIERPFDPALTGKIVETELSDQDCEGIRTEPEE